MNILPSKSHMYNKAHPKTSNIYLAIHILSVACMCLEVGQSNLLVTGRGEWLE